MNFIRVILYIISVYLIFKWIVGPLLRMLLKNYLKKVVQNQTGSFHKQPPNQGRKPEGTLHVDYVPKSPKKPNSGDSEGEYIDYEEVK